MVIRPATPGPELSRPQGSRGAAVVLTVLVMLVAAVSLSVLAMTSRVVGARARAQTAADATAIAAAYDGEGHAREVADAHGARVVAILSRVRDRATVVDVEVEMLGVHAQATAERTECRGSCAPYP